MTEIIETVRLRLRSFTLGDIDGLHNLWNEPGLRKFLWDNEPVSTDHVKEIIEKSIALFQTRAFGLWAIIHKQREALIGFCGFWHFHEPPTLELLYGLSESYWHQGLGQEAATELLSYGFDKLGFDRIEASTDSANRASIVVMERLGMKFWKRETTNSLDTIYYCISREAFQHRALGAKG
jgi:ribosomal-protein-alanine N-acetyltransferase